MRTARLSFSVVLASGSLLFGCSGKEPAPPQPPPPPTSSVTPPASSAPASSSPPAGPEMLEALPSQAPPSFAPGDPAAPPEKAPTVAIKAPVKDQVISRDKAGDFEVRLDVKNWETKHGAHVHLILDGRPYLRVDDPRQPIKLKDIDPTLELKDGQHLLVAFPSRMTHESVKPIGKSSPAVIVPFWIGKKGEVTWKPGDPTLVYSRPKGAYDEVPPEGLLVDFYLFHAELGDGKYAVKATLDGPGAAGVSTVIKEWRPFRILHLAQGTYSLAMTLVDKDGKPVPGPQNDVKREFTVNRAAAPSAPRAGAGEHAGHAAPPPSASAPAK